MIGQYLSNINKSTTISILQKILELNKAWVCFYFSWHVAASLLSPEWKFKLLQKKKHYALFNPRKNLGFATVVFLALFDHYYSNYRLVRLKRFLINYR